MLNDSDIYIILYTVVREAGILYRQGENKKLKYLCFLLVVMTYPFVTWPVSHVTTPSFPYLSAPVALVVEVVKRGVKLARVATLRVCRLVAAHRPVDGQPIVATRHTAHHLLLCLAGDVGVT